MLSLLLALSLAQPKPALIPTDITGPIFPRSAVSFPNPSFLAFPANGIGVSGECSSTVPTGATHGEVITFSRAGGQTCTRANGNVVKMTANQPVVETLTGVALSDGNSVTGGPQLGMLDEASVTNVLLQSEDMTNAAWISSALHVAAVIRTADQAFAPDGTLTADRLQIAASTSADFSLIDQPLSNSTYSCSVYIKGVSGSGLVHLMVAGSGTACQTCNFTNTSFTRCVLAGASAVGASFYLGLDPLDCGGGNQSAQDVYAWGTQCEVNSIPTSYIPTTTVAVTRSATSWTVDTTTFTPPVTSAAGCFGADAYFSKWETEAATVYGCGFSGASIGSRVPYEAHIGVGNNQMRIFDGVNQNSSTGLGVGSYAGQLQSAYGFWLTATGINSNSNRWGGGTLQATYNNGVIGAAGTGGGYTLGHTAAGCGLNQAAWLTRIRMDTDNTGAKCR